VELDARGRRLRAALAAVLMPDNAPELRLVREWLDSWTEVRPHHRRDGVARLRPAADGVCGRDWRAKAPTASSWPDYPTSRHELPPDALRGLVAAPSCVTPFRLLVVASTSATTGRRGPLGPGGVTVGDRMVREFTKEQIEDAICMVVGRYGQMVQDGRREFYGGSTERAIQAAAQELVSEQYLPPQLAEIAVTKATAFVARSGRR
jgi:hypothetical protein